MKEEKRDPNEDRFNEKRDLRKVYEHPYLEGCEIPI